MPKKINEAERKRLADEIVNNPLFEEIAEELDVAYYQRWVEATEKNKREWTHAHATALREVLALLRFIAARAEDEPQVDTSQIITDSDLRMPLNA